MRSPPWLKERHPRLHHFLVRGDAPWPFVRDLAGLALVGFTLYLVLVSATGQFFHGPPVVVVESGSMMRCANGIDLGHGGGACEARRYGRVGTIDPGDLIFVRDIDGRGDIATFAEGGHRRYGDAGDTVIYVANGAAGGTPVIHRAMFWLEVNADGTVSIPELGVDHRDAGTLSVDGLGLDRAVYRLSPGCRSVADLHGVPPGSGGFVTKGDNNPCFDQSLEGFRYQPVRPEWILGKARGEVPWVGLVKLFVFDILQGTSHYAVAPGDLKTMMWITLLVVIGGPLAAEAVAKRRRARAGEGAGADPDGGEDVGDEPGEGPRSPPPA